MVLGFAASGSIALVLSGGAYAANSGVDTISQNTNEVAAVGAKTSESTVSEKITVGSKPVIDSKISPTASEGTSADSAVSAEVSLPVVNNATAPVSSEVSKTQGGMSHIADPVAKDDAKLKTENLVVASEKSISSASGSTQVVAPVVAASSAAPDDNTITFGARVLEIQPVITATRVAPVRDLAASVPTATDQTHDAPELPVPAKSTGLFTRLTSELAGVVVPPSASVPTLDRAGFITLLLFFATAALLLGLAGLNFGAWLRRSGYTNAARSDVSGAFFSLFATPMSLSYVTANQPTHSSFLMVSENKTDPITVPNAFRKEEMK